MFGHNKGFGGLFSKGGRGSLPGGGQGPRQLTLMASEGFSGNGMATIGMDNTFSVLANLPPVHMISPHAPAVYAAYLVDKRGQNGFYAGTLRPAGNGMFQASFRSPIPLVHYDKVVISAENPRNIMQAPQGPIVLSAKGGGLIDALGPVKEKGGELWGKFRGFISERFGGRQTAPPEQPPVQTRTEQAGPQQYTSQSYTAPGSQYYNPQAGYQPQGIPQQGRQYSHYQQSILQQGMPPQGSYQPPGGYSPRIYPQQGYSRPGDYYQGGVNPRFFGGYYYPGQQQYMPAQPGQNQYGSQEAVQPPAAAESSPAAVTYEEQVPQAKAVEEVNAEQAQQPSPGSGESNTE